MAALSGGVQFSEVDGKSLLYVGASQEDDKIIVTYRDKRISLHDIEDHKVFKSWSVQYSVKLTCQVVYDTYSSQYLSVQNHREIRLWGPDELNLDKAKKTVAPKEIVLIYPPGHGCEPVIVFCDFSLCLLSTIKDATSYPHHVQPDECLLWCDVIVASVASPHASPVIYAVGLISNSNRVTRLCCLSMTLEGDVSENSFCHEFTDSTQTFISASLVTDETTIYIYVLNSSGNIHQTSFHTLDNRWSSDAQLCVQSSMPQNMAIIALDASQVAVAGISHNQMDGVAIFNVKFACILCFQPYPQPRTGSVKMFHACHHLLVLWDDTLYSYKLTHQPSTLLSVLGCQTLDTPISSSLSLISWSDSTTQGDADRISQLFDKLLDDKQMPHAKFEGSFIELLTLLESDDHHHVWSSQHMVAVINRCINEPVLWSAAVTERIIAHGQLPTSCVQGFFEALIKRRKNNLLLKALSNIGDIPEIIIVKVIDYVLSSHFLLKKRSKSRKSEDSGVALTGSLTTDQAKFINLILSLPYNDVFLLESLRSLKFGDVLMLLNYFHFVMVDEDMETESSKSLNKIKLETVVDWLCLLVDAHVTQLILSPDARPILVSLHQVVLSQVEFYNSLVELEALLSVMKTKSGLPSLGSVGHYCIEVLHLP